MVAPLGRVLAPGLVFEALGAAPAHFGPVVPEGYRQIEGAVPVQVGQLGAQQISPMVDLAAGLRKPLGASPIEVETLFLGVVVEEKQFRIAVAVQVSGFAVHGADAGDGAAALGGEPGGTVPVDVGFQMVGVTVALTALGAVVGKGQVQVAVPVEIGGFHVGRHQSRQLGAPVRPITLRASPVDQGLHVDRVVVDEVAEDDLQVAVPVEIGQQRRSPSIGGEPGDAAVPGADFPQQLAQRLLVGKGRQNRPRALGGSPVDQEVFVLQLVVVLGHEEVEVAVVVQVQGVDHAHRPRASDVEIGAPVPETAAGEVREVGMVQPSLVDLFPQCPAGPTEADQDRNAQQKSHGFILFRIPSRLDLGGCYGIWRGGVKRFQGPGRAAAPGSEASQRQGRGDRPAGPGDTSRPESSGGIRAGPEAAIPWGFLPIRGWPAALYKEPQT